MAEQAGCHPGVGCHVSTFNPVGSLVRVSQAAEQTQQSLRCFFCLAGTPWSAAMIT